MAARGISSETLDSSVCHLESYKAIQSIKGSEHTVPFEYKPDLSEGGQKREAEVGSGVYFSHSCFLFVFSIGLDLMK